MDVAHRSWTLHVGSLALKVGASRGQNPTYLPIPSDASLLLPVIAEALHQLFTAEACRGRMDVTVRLPLLFQQECGHSLLRKTAHSAYALLVGDIHWPRLFATRAQQQPIFRSDFSKATQLSQVCQLQGFSAAVSCQHHRRGAACASGCQQASSAYLT
jgi:hypothetical protein